MFVSVIVLWMSEVWSEYHRTVYNITKQSTNNSVRI